MLPVAPVASVVLAMVTSLRDRFAGSTSRRPIAASQENDEVLTSVKVRVPRYTYIVNVRSHYAC